MSIAQRLRVLIEDLPRHGPPIAAALRGAGARLQVAASVVSMASDAVDPIRETIQACREGRVRVEVRDGQPHVVIDPPRA